MPKKDRTELNRELEAFAVQIPSANSGFRMQLGETFIQNVKDGKIKGFEYKVRDPYRNDLFHDTSRIDLYTDYELIMDNLYVKNRSSYKVEVEDEKGLLAFKEKLLSKPFMCHAKLHLMLKEDLTQKLSNDFFVTVFPENPDVKAAIEKGFQHALDCVKNKKHYKVWFTPEIWFWYKDFVTNATKTQFEFGDLRYSKIELNDKKGFFSSSKDLNCPIKPSIIELVTTEAIMPDGY